MEIPGSSISKSPAEDTERAGRVTTSGWTFAALIVASAGVAGSLFLSLWMELKACPLCFYQRAFAMSAFGVLAVGLFAGGRPAPWLSLLVLPPVVAGLGVALFHVYLEIAGKLECPLGVFGWGTAPKQSLALFVVLTIVLVADVLRGIRAKAAYWHTTAIAVVVGGVLAAASCISNPPMPSAPTERYAKPPEVCRPPFHAP